LLQGSDLSQKRQQAYWYVPVQAQLADSFYQHIQTTLSLSSPNQSLTAEESIQA
jgi:hypothetical protein